MKKESLIELRNATIDYLKSNETIDKIDNLELSINMQHFLDPNEYDNNIKVLRLEQDKRKWKR